MFKKTAHLYSSCKNYFVIEFIHKNKSIFGKELIKMPYINSDTIPGSQFKTFHFCTVHQRETTNLLKWKGLPGGIFILNFFSSYSWIVPFFI